MKTFVYFLISIASICCLVGIASSKADASDYLGEYCFQIHITQNEKGQTDGTGTIKLDVTYMGGTSLTAQGFSISDDPVIIGGSGQLIGDEAIFTLNYSQQHSSPWRDSGIWQMRINLSNLSGTVWSNYMSFNATTGAYNGEGGFDLGTVTYISCP